MCNMVKGICIAETIYYTYKTLQKDFVQQYNRILLLVIYIIFSL